MFKENSPWIGFRKVFRRLSQRSTRRLKTSVSKCKQDTHADVTWTSPPALTAQTYRNGEADLILRFVKCNKRI